MAKEVEEKSANVDKIHAEIIAMEACGEKFDSSTLFVHDQEHFANALIIINFLDFLLNCLKENTLKQK